MTAFDRIHRFNTKLAGTVTTTASLIYNSVAVIAGIAVIFFAWRLPGFYGFELNGWLGYAPYAVTAAAEPRLDGLEGPEPGVAGVSCRERLIHVSAPFESP